MAGRVVFYGLHQLEKIEIAPVGTRHAAAIGGVMIFGADHLDSACPAGNPAEIALTLQLQDQAMCKVLGLLPRTGADLIIAWRNAMELYMGADEFEKFCLAWRKRHGWPRTR